MVEFLPSGFTNRFYEWFLFGLFLSFTFILIVLVDLSVLIGLIIFELLQFLFVFILIINLAELVFEEFTIIFEGGLILILLPFKLIFEIFFAIHHCFFLMVFIFFGWY